MVAPAVIKSVMAENVRRVSMRRFVLLLSVSAIVLLGLIALGSASTTRAQDATPLAGGLPFEIAPGVTADILPPLEDPPSLYRVRFAPGVTYKLESSPAISLVYVEAGTLVQHLDGPVTVVRAGATDAPGEPMAADAEVTLSAGDYTTVPPEVGGEIRNEGQDPAQVAVAELVPEHLAMSLMATPVP
jgi:hypothetical protein